MSFTWLASKSNILQVRTLNLAFLQGCAGGLHLQGGKQRVARGLRGLELGLGQRLGLVPVQVWVPLQGGPAESRLYRDLR